MKPKLLTAEETAELTLKAQAGDIDARNTLIERNYALAVTVARKCLRNIPHEMDLDDLIHEAIIGMADAIAIYIPGKSAFSGHAYRIMRQRVRGAIQDKGTTIRIPRYIYEVQGVLAKTIPNYLKMPTEEVARKSGISEFTVGMAQRPRPKRRSVERSNRIGKMLAEASDPQDRVDAAMDAEIILSKSWLTKREDEAIRSMFGLGRDIETITEAARRRGYSQVAESRPRRLAIQKIREWAEMRKLIG